MQSIFITHLEMSKSELHKIYPSSESGIFFENNNYIYRYIINDSKWSKA